MHYASNKVTLKEEYYTYDIASFTADFGGFLGLLLGYSILKLHDTLKAMLSRLRVFAKKKSAYRTPKIKVIEIDEQPKLKRRERSGNLLSRIQ